jgi:serine phosphatase RsbU (regulator of sigma subunit)
MTDMLTGAKILVVDDEPGMLRAVARVLDRAHSVLALESPSAALAEVASFRPDVAVLDIRMPEMDGFELMQRIRVEAPDVDVILMTGSIAEPDAHLIRAIDEGAFYFVQKPFDRRVLWTIVARCLELRRLRQEKQRRVVRLEREMAVARQFQVSLLPPVENAVAGVDLAARYIACDELAGDFYDYATADDGRLGVLVADVSGHGASAAMLTGIVKSAFHATHADDYDPLAVVDRVSNGMRTFDARRFVTLFAARFDVAAGTIEYVNAGHPPALVRRSDGTEQLDSTGPLVSPIFRELPWECATTSLGTGDDLLLYTDGLLDVQGGEGMFGRERLVGLVTGSSQRGAALLDDIHAAVEIWAGRRPFTDDVTMLSAALQTAAAPVTAAEGTTGPR